jgi:hypothetical protein
VDDPFAELKRLKWVPSRARRKNRAKAQIAGPKLPRPKRGEAFLGGPIPMSWIAAATRLSGRTWQVATALWFVGIRSRSKSATVALTPKTLARFHLSENAVRRGLSALAAAGLVIVERQTGRRSLVTILPAPVPRGRDV